MGLKDYFHPVEKNVDPQRPAGPAMVQHKPRLSNFPSPPSNGLRAKQTSVPFVPHDTESIGVPAPSSSVISRSTASPVSRAFYPGGDSGNGSSLHLTDMKADVMANWLYHRQQEKMWTFGGFDEGVILKKARDEYASCPPELLQNRDGFHDSARKLNVKCALTIKTQVVRLLLGNKNMAYIPLYNGLRIQVLPNFTYLPACQKHHFAAFIQDPAILVIWDDDPKHLFSRAQNVEDQLMKMVWNRGEADNEKSSTAVPSKTGGSRPPSIYANDIYSSRHSNNDESLAEMPRRIVLIQPVLTAITLILVIAAIGAGWRQVAMEVAADKGWIRLGFVAAAPLQIWLALFFMQSIAGCVAQIIGPIAQMTENTKFYSGSAPTRLLHGSLPHVTIQCPVYKEGLWSVIDPTVKSIKEAISTYEMQGGSANIFINDDGMQLISAEDAQDRRDYYEEHNIGWVARPKHSPKPKDGEKAFVRPGKFKKASNMNYALSVSVRVEDRLADLNREGGWSQQQEFEAYDHALAQVIEEDQGRTWAEGNVRVGDYILLIDSDTRVPTDCFLDAVSEMEASPQVAIIQFSSGVMNVTDTFFEKGITFFTNLIYTAIQFAVANGDVAPFVGHNAFLRWSAIQDIAYLGDDGITEKYWSESTVSEDFDMALRLQTTGYVLRLAAYAGQGFKEGVSLTVYDELARWEKYAYGCNELIFHPLRYWISRGPFTPLFRRFIFSNMPLPSKVTIMAYIGTYYAIGSAWLLTVANYLLIGWYTGWLDLYYVDSFKIYFAIVLVFSGLGNVALAILRYRIEERSLFGSLLENLKWVPLMTVFLGGISLHVSQALLSHMFSIDMSWGATAKEARDTSFFEEVPRILTKFKFTFIWCIFMITTIIVLAGVGPLGALVPYHWHINYFTAIWPLATVVASHFLLPIVLNPGLMLFTW